MFDHATYLYISFGKAVDLKHLFVNSALTTKTTEIRRIQNNNEKWGIKIGDSVMKIEQMMGNNGSGYYTSAYFDLVRLRKKMEYELHEDSKMTNKIFADLLISKPHNVEIISFKNDLPISFNKKYNKIEDEENKIFQEDLKNPIGESFVKGPPIELSKLQNQGISIGGKTKKQKTKRIRKIQKRKTHKRKNT